MARRMAYDVNAPWDDPCEKKDERRIASRAHSQFKITVTVERTSTALQLVGPGLVKDLSDTGVLMLTKHQLHAGQQVTLIIPTNFCPDSMGMPEAFLGPAEVIRVKPVDERRNLSALHFGPALSNNMEFAVFLEYLRSVSAMMTAS